MIKKRLFELAASPMAITERAFRALAMQAAKLPDMVPMSAEKGASWLEALEEFYGPPAVREETMGGVRIIHVTGVIDRFVPTVWRHLGYVDVDLVAERVEAAVMDETVNSIVLAMNSPGGTVYGTAEAGDEIAAASADKPLVVHASNMLASGGYWLAAGASAILADPTAEIGSVGVYTPMWDFRGWYESLGMSVELAKTGALKGGGFPGTEWTEEQKDHEREIVGDYYAAFTGHVNAHRRIAANRLTGGVYVAARAKEYGFIDAIGSLEDAVALAGDLGGRVKQNAQ